MTNFKSSYGVAIALVLLLQACGGGGGGGGTTALSYSGLTTQATLDSDNADELARAGASGAHQAVGSESTPTVFRSGMATEAQLQDLAVRIMQQMRNGGYATAARGTAARTDNVSYEFCPGGGSAYMTIPDSATETNFTATLDFSNCTDNSVPGTLYVYSGRVRMSYSESPGNFSLTIAYENFTVSITEAYTQTATINMSLMCGGTDTTGYTDMTCTYYSDFTGSDGRVYRVGEFTVSGDSSGYTVSATVYHPDYGYVTVATTVPLTFNCTGGYPDSGTLVVTAAGDDSATVDFISCSQYSVTYSSVTTDYDW